MATRTTSRKYLVKGWRLRGEIALGQLYAAAKRPEQARQVYRAARAVIDRVNAGLLNSELRIGLDHSLLFQHVNGLSPSS